MISLGMAFIGLTLLAGFLHWRGTLYETRWLMWIFVFAVAGALAANQFGWVAAEVGRQPWVVYPPVEWTADGDVVVGPSGVVEYDEVEGLRTADGVSASVDASQVLASLLGFGFIYLCLGAAWLYVLDRKIRHGPEPVEGDHHGGGFMEAVSSLIDHSESLTGSGEGS
jgi:cytochrome d ubiquinol oxidase subunit I